MPCLHGVCVALCVCVCAQTTVPEFRIEVSFVSFWA